MMPTFDPFMLEKKLRRDMYQGLKNIIPLKKIEFDEYSYQNPVINKTL